MKDDEIYIKSLVFGIIIILIGAAVVPSISGQNNKINNQTNNNELISFPINNDDYTNAYWKFDQGSGTTAYDSSGHGYHGTINGASWTTGNSSYALLFDGVNDYVDFDDYSKNNLGFNRTDDLIFSFYFKTSSTDKGIIYSSCRGDAYGYNPGFHIALLPNGSIEVQVWRLNCGILMSSSSAYNNGAWRFAEIYYNGDSAHPTVDIYVDANYDNTSEKYVCAFYSDQFKYTDMGRNSAEETDYFEGKIDEFKITKYPGGNEQISPSIDGPAYGDPGVEYEYTFVTNDTEGDESWFMIDWGYGDITDWYGPYDPGVEVTLNHTWNYSELYEVKTKSKDRWDDSWWSQAYPVRIGNWPPFAPTIYGPKSGNTNQVLTYTFLTEDFEGEDVFYYVEWGDDSVTDWFGPFPSGQEVTSSHMWGTEDIYEIKAKAKDINNDVGDWSEVYLISIGNDAPMVPDINGPREGNKGVEYHYSFSSVDPDGDNVLYEINWGDGNIEVTGYNPSGEEVVGSHTWTTKGTYTIKARACDVFEEWGAYKEITVTIPRDRSLNFDHLEWLVERFPFLEKLLQNFRQ
jgi:hypothetical protein